MNATCYHCGTTSNDETIFFDEKSFCCNGCKTVYEIFSANDLTCYYDLENNPGAIPNEKRDSYDYLDNEDIIEKLLDFNDNQSQIVTLYIPHIHCSSCIWVLENLHKLQPHIKTTQVNFPKKTIRVTFNSNHMSLKEVVLLLSSIGYEPYISLDDYEVNTKKSDRSLIYKLGLAGFAFGNIMFLSFPEYFETNEFWIEKYKHTFHWLMFGFSLPVVFYASQDYFKSAYKGVLSKILNIDVPIALGILVLFIRSSVEVFFDLGSGFFDSLTGLVFFLLLGKFFQQKTYSYLSFERDYKSYFPIAVTKINTNQSEENIQIYEVKKGDRLLIRNLELIPVDGILINGKANIDYSFVTGEADPITKESGDKIFAGGKQLSGAIEMEVLKSVEQSYLTQLWSNAIFEKDKQSGFKTLTNRISQHFTIVILVIAILATTFWLFIDATKALNVFTAVLIIACPCAIALAAPFTMGNMLRIFGKKKFYLKNAVVIEQLAAINALVFDKTGTLTTNRNSSLVFNGDELTNEEKSFVKTTVRNSNHPLSRRVYNELKDITIMPTAKVREIVGKGIQATINDQQIKIGSSSFIQNKLTPLNLDTSVHVSFNDVYKGKYTLNSNYRPNIKEVFNAFSTYDLAVVSGDNEGERKNLQKILPKKTNLHFNYKPENKLSFVANLQDKNKQVAMIGDGLNDAGALSQSNVGIAVSENINVFSPACDAILDATQFNKLHLFVKASKQSVKIIKYSFILSLIYNIIGLYFAISGQLLPVIAAILMPLSSISIVVFTTVMTNLIGRKL